MPLETVLTDSINNATPLTATATILVCDDDPTVRLLARECLESDSMKVLEAKNGEEALALFAQCQPDLIFLDVDMPRLNGFAVCKAIRQTEK